MQYNMRCIQTLYNEMELKVWLSAFVHWFWDSYSFLFVKLEKERKLTFNSK